MESCLKCALDRNYSSIPINGAFRGKNMTYNWNIVNQNYPNLSCDLPMLQHGKHGNHTFPSEEEVTQYMQVYHTLLKLFRGKLITDKELESAHQQ